MKYLNRTGGAALAALVLTFTASSALAQRTVLMDWGYEWSWMHPMGAQPPRPAGGADVDFTTTWYLKEADFATLYDGPLFGNVPKTTGLTGTTTSYDSGRGPGPVAYGDFQYTTTPLPAGSAAEFTAIGSLLTTPLSGNRHTGYFRTTFTVPDDGKAYQNPVLRYIMDDGGYVYLDGELILRVNMLATVSDTYTQITEGKVDTESVIRNAQLYDPVNAPATGGNSLVTPAIVGNARVIKPVTSLAPGVHTLAISVHNEGGTSSDIGLAVQLLADVSDCVITASGTTAVRNLGGDPENLANDTLDFDVTVTGTGILSPAGWVVSGPAGSSLIGQTGTYGVARHFSGVPLTEFPQPGGLVLEVQDAASLNCRASYPFQAPQRMGSISVGALSGLILNKVPWTPVWSIDETAGTMTLHNAGAGADRIVESMPIDLSGVSGDVKFSAELVVDNTSTALELGDTFLAELLLSDGVNTTTVNLVAGYDLDGSGRMNGGATAAADEFNKEHLTTGAYNFTFPLSTVIPDNITSATFVIRGVNDSTSETFTVKNVLMQAATHSIEIAAAGPVVFNNQSTVDPADDTFSAPVNVAAASLPPGSLGWTSNVTPASGLYATANPVVFGPFLVSGGAQSITLTDNPVVAVVSNTLTVNPPAAAGITAAIVAGSITRNANGPGLADDTVTFQATVSGTNASPAFTASASDGVIISPVSGTYAGSPVTFTLSSVPPSGNITVTLTDAGYTAATTTLTVAMPVVSVIGTVNFGTAAELLTTGAPAVEWNIDSTNRFLTMTTGGTGDKIVDSAILDLSSVGAVAFTAKFRAYETSLTSNFENTDKFKAELIIDGVAVNLISQWDTGNGSFGSLGPNGAPDGYLNGYRGEGATNAAIAADYNLYPERDEFNRGVLTAEDTIDNTFDLAYTIPADANSVQLKIYGTGISGSEYFVVSEILFTSTAVDPDTDTDGIPDGVETAAGLNPADPGDAALDLDGDGQTNLAEFRAGTSITDSQSSLRVTAATLSGTSATVRWASVAGKSYRVQTAPALTGPWTTLPTTYTGAPSTVAGPDFGTQAATVALPVPQPGAYFLRVVIP